ncbi:MAG: chemotaxis protein CheW [Rhodoblastus sp.]
MDDILRDFLVETAEHIDAAGEQLVRLERDPSDAEMISSIFRLVHTIKGTCGFLGLARLARVTHAAESLIGRLRDGAPANPETVTLILSTIDRIKSILGDIEQGGEEPEGDDAELIAALAAHAALMTAGAPHPAPIVADSDAARPPTASEAATTVDATGAADSGPSPARPPSHAEATHEEAPTHTSEHTGADHVRPLRADTIRVAVDALESLMLLVSELVLTRNQLTEVTRSNTDEAVKGALQRLSAVATDLQDAVMRARMQPMSRIFGALPRLVRELAVELGKKIDLVVDGAETELDRQILEQIRDPLTHMIRNCADHGLEPPVDRVRSGKPETGIIRVSASHEAGQISIEVLDDGRGLDHEAIRRKAAALELASEQELAAMSPDEVARFIFVPGFSTARAVTSVSGRGVGLDVVRENIQTIGGVVSVASRPGAGTRFVIRIPLTLAIAPALIVAAGGQRFALPQAGVVEAVSVGPESEHKIEVVQGAPMLRLRNEVVPIADLHDLLGVQPMESGADDERLVVVMRVAAATFGLIVQAVEDVQEIVVKPLGSPLAHLKVYSGQTILGDGSVVLILDSGGIAETLGLERAASYREARADVAIAPRQSRTRVVLLRAGQGARKALPLSLITRIESVDTAAVEQTGAGYVLRHRGQLMPLLPAADGVAPTHANQPVLVIGYGGETMGLLVDEIIDIVEDPLEIQIAQGAPGVIGTAEFGGVVAELLDLTHFIRIGRPNSASRGVNRKFKILLVDDRQFFRDMLTPVLSAAGYHVTTLASAPEALALIDKGMHFDAVVTDIDMPEVDGYRFARDLRAMASCARVPIVALVAQANEKTTMAATAAGIDAIAGKFDRRALLDTLAGALGDATLGEHSLEEQFLKGAAA